MLRDVRTTVAAAVVLMVTASGCGGGGETGKGDQKPPGTHWSNRAFLTDVLAPHCSPDFGCGIGECSLVWRGQSCPHSLRTYDLWVNRRVAAMWLFSEFSPALNPRQTLDRLECRLAASEDSSTDFRAHFDVYVDGNRRGSGWDVTLNQSRSAR